MLVDMKKLVLIAHGSKRNKILRALHRSKLVEISETKEIENTNNFDAQEKIENLETNIQRIDNSIEFLNAEKKKGKDLVKDSKKAEELNFSYEPIKTVPFQSIARISYDDYLGIGKKDESLMKSIDSLEKIQTSYNELNSEKLKINNFIENIEIFKNVDRKFSDFVDTKFTSVTLGYFPSQYKMQVVKNLSKIEMVSFEMFEGAKFVPISIVCLNDKQESINTLLQQFEYVKVNFDFDQRPKQIIYHKKKRLEEIENTKIDLLKKSLSYEKHLVDLKQYYDFVLVEIAKSRASQSTKCTNSVFVLEGWFPAKEQKRMSKILQTSCKEIIFEFRDPDEKEEVPTLIRSGKLIDPYQDVTNMYSVPNYRNDFDPNPLMSFFYFFIFGMMLQDAGYGLVLAIGGLVMLKLTKPVPGKGRLLLLITLGGLSTIFWGVIFGGYFGFAEIGFLNKIVAFKPLDEPLAMLGLSFAVGIVHVLAGMLCNAYNLIRKGRGWEAFFNVFSWLIAFVGIALVAVNMFFVKADAMKIVGFVVIGIGLLILVLGGAYGKKGAKKKIFGAVGGVAKIYDGVNYMSDILSYSRIFGLGLSGGVVAMVINRICLVIIGMMASAGNATSLVNAFQISSKPGLVVLGAIICVPIFAFGHLFNLFISTLGAYVHNARLQYIEFYGKFYEGAGHQFKPLGSDTKYTYIDTSSKTEIKNKKQKTAKAVV